MGIVNCTPDSFHANSRSEDSQSAIEHGLAMWAEGADWVDVGGESTRPGALPVSIEEEIDRVIPVIHALRSANPDGLISIDSRNVEVARRAIEAGADMVNDVTGLRQKGMQDLIVESGCAVCIMHMLGTPSNMQDQPQYGDVVREVAQELGERADALTQRGHDVTLICLDPGIGFGKRLQDNLDLLQDPWALRGESDYSVMWGVSRKSIFRDLLGREDSEDRLSGSLGVAAAGMQMGVDILRVHDVREHADLLNTMAALENVEPSVA